MMNEGGVGFLVLFGTPTKNHIIIIVYLQSKGADWLQQLGKYSAQAS